jgi:hypothetical protein
MSKSFFYLSFFFLLVSLSFINGQETKLEKRGDVRIMFYNTENFFDTIDNPLKEDNDFLPGSKLKWDKWRYNKKVQHIYQSIAAVGEMRPPEIIGFSEIETRKVLSDLVYHTPLEKYNYKIIHKDSPDQRGIDVALIYRADIIKCLDTSFISIRFPGNSKKTTRDILYFKALINGDTLNIFINHWPSRRGGQKKSEPARNYVAGVLKQKIDLLLKSNPKAKILITGDFNDEPDNISLSEILAAQKSFENIQPGSLYNLSWRIKDSCLCGTYRMGNYWDMLDQFIVSGSILMKGRITASKSSNHIGNFSFLLVEDKKYGGYKPFRTYQGPAYKGGFSDHLPVYIDLKFSH